MKQKYCFRLLKCLVLMGVLICFNYVANAQNFFDSSAIRQVLYKDATHAYDDAQVILFSKKRVPVLRSNLIPVQVGDKVELSTFVHYSSASSGETWKKIGATAAGLAIGSLPYLMEKGDGGLETGNDHSGLSKTVAPLVGAGIAALAFATGKRKGKSISRDVSFPKSRNGIFVPDAYLKYNLYDSEGNLLKTDYQNIDKQAKDAWQKLYLYEEVQQDGYVQIELGNGSKKPVWMDGVQIQRKTREKNISLKDANTAKDTLGILPTDSIYFGVTTNNSGPTNMPPGPEMEDGGGSGNNPGPGIISGKGTWDDPYKMSSAVVTAPPLDPDHLNTTQIDQYKNYHSGGATGYAPGYYSTSSSNPNSGSGNDPVSQPSDFDPNDNIPPHPGKKDWNSMSNAEKVVHMLKIIRYVFVGGNGASIINLNNFFTNLPTVSGNTHVIINTTVLIDGINIPIRMEIPIHPDLRSFETYPVSIVANPDGRSTLKYGRGNIHSGLGVNLPSHYEYDLQNYLYP